MLETASVVCFLRCCHDADDKMLFRLAGDTESFKHVLTRPPMIRFPRCYAGEEAEHRHTASPGLRSRLLGAAAQGLVLAQVPLPTETTIFWQSESSAGMSCLLKPASSRPGRLRAVEALQCPLRTYSTHITCLP